MSQDHAFRKTHHIRSRSASGFFKGAAHAKSHGRPLNLHVTLNMWQTNYPSDHVSVAVARICGKFTRWLAYQSQKAGQQGKGDYGRPTYQTVIESPKGNYHLHWLVHVPTDLADAFAACVPRWFSKVCGEAQNPTKAIHIKRIDSVMALSRYCMKGVDPQHAKRCYVRPINQGVVFGKRVSISRSLGPLARRKEQSASVSGSNAPSPTRF